MKLKICGVLLALSAISLFGEEDLSVGKLRKRLANMVASETVVDDSLSEGSSVQNTPTHPTHEKSLQHTHTCYYEYSQRLQIGGSYSYAWITPKGSATTSGDLAGAQAIYEYRPQDSVYAGVAFHWRAGKTTNHARSRTLEDFNLQERLGYTFPSKTNKFRATLFTGIGARYMEEKAKLDSSSVKFDYTQFYVPVGILLENQVFSAFSIGCNFQWMPQVFSLVKIQTLNGRWFDLKEDIRNFAVDVPFKFSPGKKHNFEFIIDPYVEYWRDGHITAKTMRGVALVLPSNKYVFTGVNVNLAFLF